MGAGAGDRGTLLMDGHYSGNNYAPQAPQEYIEIGESTMSDSNATPPQRASSTVTKRRAPTSLP